MLKWHHQEDQMNNRTTQYNSNQYDRIRILGKGSFGTATVHRRRTDCTLVVLKEIDLSKFRNEQDRKSLIQEARIMSKLNHINIIKYHNAYLTETKLIIEMEYASIGTLQAYLSFQNQPLDEQEILVIFRQIASGLSYLHSKNIIHLDLKMANIFVTIEGQVKIGDFGIAQIMQSADEMTMQTNSIRENNEKSHNTATGRTNRKPMTKRRLTNNSHQLGTLAYSSPERCLGEPIDCKSDIWSLGCILYELITSRPLFASNSLSELVLNITTIQYEPIKQVISQALRETFEQMIARNPIDRPTAYELLCLSNQLISAIHGHRQRSNSQGKQRGFYHHHHNQRVNFSSEAVFMANDRNDFIQPSINYPHSIVYQVRLDTRHIQIERVNLPQTKRIKEICKGRSHYLVLTYCNIVYGWGSKNYGQLGACSLTSSSLASSSTTTGGTRSQVLRATRSTRNSMVNAFDMADSSQASSSAASSLASSTQTIVASGPNSNKNFSTNAGGQGNNMSSAATTSNLSNTNQRPSKQLIKSLLEKSRPTSKPFIINELNNKKVIQVAAGNDFSVFLSKTGIVMTCGDGSTGCLGRGDLTSCFMPSMVDALLNCDVVGIACGPRHVVAVCGDGRAFAWGKWTRGRLGIELIKPATFDEINKNDYRFEKCSENRHNGRMVSYSNLNIEHSSSKSTASKIIIGKYVVRPQLVQLPQDVFIKNAFCGDRCTIFIDSTDRCWACGENNSNKLGLDIKRRFKKTIVISHSWLPIEIITLGKYKISTCTISKNHSSFVTSEGKLIVCGQDIDNSHRLKSNIVGNRESHRRISAELQTIRRRSQMNSLQNVSIPKCTGTMTGSQSKMFLHHKQLTQSLLSNDQLLEFKYSRTNELNNIDFELGDYRPPLPKYKIKKFQRQQIDSYLKKTRSTKKMPFEYVISASCFAKFTLTLTNDNRVYFWGTRSYEKSGSRLDSILTESHHKNNLMKDKCVEPQLISANSDECFIKIGYTNNSLMSNIQLLGSDQPIIQAQDPRLSASSLADLWILDYEPTTSSSSDSSSAVSSSDSSIASLEPKCCEKCFDSEEKSDCCSCCDQSDCSLNSTRDYVNEFELDEPSFLKHDAILEPQPIVSLYVPSMFNHSGCHLNLVNMFCFDESRFYLILDTTIRVQSQSHTRSSLRSTRLTHQFDVGRFQQQLQIQQQNQLPSLPLPKIKLSPVTEPNTSSANHKPQQMQLNESTCNENGRQEKVDMANINQQEAHDVRIYISNQECCTNIGKSDTDWVEGAKINSKISDDRIIAEFGQQCCSKEGLQMKCSASKELDHNNLIVDDNCISNNNTQGDSSSSQCGVSLDEPRSFSTFAAAMSNHIIVGPTMNPLAVNQSLQPLSFNQRSQIDEFSQLESSPRDYLSSSLASNRSQFQAYKRARRRRPNKSESTTFTGDDVDDTSSMPSWVKNEFFNYQTATNGLNHSDPEVFALELSPNDRLNDDDGDSEGSDATLASKNNHQDSALRENGCNPSMEDHSINTLEVSVAYEDVDKREEGKVTKQSLSHSEKFHDNPLTCDSLHEQQFLSMEQELSSASLATTRFIGEPASTKSNRSILKRKTSIPRARLISLSQPDISDQQDHYHLATIKNQTRRCSLIDGDGGVSGCNGNHQSYGAGCTSNLLNCSVYKSTSRYERCISDNSYQSSAYLSAFSSRRGSVHPMIGQTKISVDLEPTVATRHNVARSGSTYSNNSLVKGTNGLNVNHVVSQSAILGGTTNELMGNNTNETVLSNCRQVHGFLHTNEHKRSMLTRSVNQLHDYHWAELDSDGLRKRWQRYEKSKAASCTSIISFRKSLAKLFC